jgi:quinol-cytochrome oxidoreductase complex cytochrome b subunit
MSQLETKGPKRFKHREYPEEDTIPFFPNYVILEVIVSWILLAGIIILVSLLPTGLEDKADPFNTPQHIKPEWYFLWIYQFIKVPSMIIGPGLAAGMAGIFVPAIGILLLIFLPFLDRRPERHPRPTHPCGRCGRPAGSHQIPGGIRGRRGCRRQ